MTSSPYLPILELTRGAIVETVHYGAFAIVDSRNNSMAAHGDPQTILYLRSAAKPFQALPLIEKDGHTHWGLTSQEIAIICASHSGTDEHAATIESIHAKINVTEDDLLCGAHPPPDSDTAFSLRSRGETPTPKRHNCSGKHSGMLALARLQDFPIEDYINPEHPIQKQILLAFSGMCGVDPEAVTLGTDGCSAPNFAIPLENAALGFARLCDPHDLPPGRARACKIITDAMISHPDMISGRGSFDTRLMEVAEGKIIAKGGAEGYQGLGIMPGAIHPGSPGIGITIKISDGDQKSRARPAVALEILSQLGALAPPQMESLSTFGPRYPLKNWRQLIVGEIRPAFEIRRR